MGNDLKKAKTRGRPRSGDAMVHTAVVLPKHLLERLRRDGGVSDRGLSGEIRRRLLSTYHLEPQRDPRTAQVVASIVTFAEGLNRYLGEPWHKSEYGKACMAGGMLARVGPYRGGNRDVPGHTDHPEMVGRIMMHQIMDAQQEVVELDQKQDE